MKKIIKNNKKGYIFNTKAIICGMLAFSTYTTLASNCSNEEVREYIEENGLDSYTSVTELESTSSIQHETTELTNASESVDESTVETTIESTTESWSDIRNYDEFPIEITEDILLAFSEQYSVCDGYYTQAESISYDSANYAINEFLINNGYATEFMYYDVFNTDFFSYYDIIYKIRNYEELCNVFSFTTERDEGGLATENQILFSSSYVMNTLRLNNVVLGDYMSNYIIDYSTFDSQSDEIYDYITEEIYDIMYNFPEGLEDDANALPMHTRNYLLRRYDNSVYCMSVGSNSLRGKPITSNQEYIDRMNEYLEENGYVYRFGEQVTWAQIGYQESIERGLNAEYNRELDQYTIDGVVQTYEDYCANYFNEADYVNEIEAAAICQENTVMYPHGPVVINEERVNELTGMGRSRTPN